MLCRTLGVYASLALAANSVLIPPNVAADSLGDDNAMELAINPFKRTVALECPGCALAMKEGNTLSWTQDAGNSFLLDFEIGAKESTLEIDGVQLYPPAFGGFTEPFYVTQVNPNQESEDALRLRVTGYTFHYNSAETITEAGAELLPMTFRITSIESKAVDPPALTINLLKDVNGRLMIASFQMAQSNEASPIDQEKECKEWPLLCKWRSILADKINGIKSHMGKGCHKHKGNPMESPEMHGKPPHTFRPGHPHHHPHHAQHSGHRHHAHHRLHMFLRRAVFTILIPILIGIFAGTLTYLIGMALGCAIAILVAKIRGRGPYESVAQQDDLEEATDKSSEKELYAELPEYDAPPVYEEAAEKEVVNESH
ncbi:uncharacterized protein BDR25DRAFT_304464 [Lindgomyces ingoldianus]|uniref:Uncharacterized protein n=1 Tax=Lindgomyces ingoldianus TaxID=673940 RepID=A0ACB6QQQ7_9PLEO|nr:uncharacterized protein BDR25DRAFT_304464 [Lindgomyces ingoldianus]KAF2469338.1 hypothetical protein BDR25DRAFT_304464 [Lindgomyces ingoldianus]